MKALLAPLAELADYEEIRKNRTKENGMIQISGCVNTQKIHLLSGIGSGCGYKLVVFSNEEKAKKAYEEYLLFGEETYLYPARDLLFYYADIKGKTLTNRRMEVLRAIAEKKKEGLCSKTIALYGGEPFLANNYDMICYITKKGKELGFSFSVISNGYDIDKYLDFLKDNKIFSFQITLDGISDIQNTRKPHWKNKDSFEKITSNIDHLLKLGFYVVIRINLDYYTLSRIDQLLLFFKERGWYNYENFEAYYALLRKDVVAKDETYKVVKKRLSQVELFKAYYRHKEEGRLDQKIKCQDYGTYRFLKSLITGHILPYKGSFCGSQTGNIIFDPLGDLYSCWDVVGIPEYSIGKYMPTLEFDKIKFKKWFYSDLSESFKCSNCKYVLTCGGGCIIASLRDIGTIQFGNCNNYPKLFNNMVKVIYDECVKNSMENE